jgi:hypothetical protein
VKLSVVGSSVQLNVDLLAKAAPFARSELTHLLADSGLRIGDVPRAAKTGFAPASLVTTDSQI